MIHIENVEIYELVKDEYYKVQVEVLGELYTFYFTYKPQKEDIFARLNEVMKK